MVIFRSFGREGQKSGFSPEDFSLRQTKPEAYVATSPLRQMQRDHGVGLFAMAGTPPEGPVTAQSQARNHRERQQYPNENEGIYHQVADIVAARGDVLVEGHFGLIEHL